jgi:threonine/homoserine/homoserine lactone efflux protein
MDVLLPLISFATVASVTPGPNNILAAADAARNGVLATVPQML